MQFVAATSPTKRKVSLSLDEEVLAELEGGEGTLSLQVNEALRDLVERRRQHRRLAAFLGRLDEQRGPVPEALIRKYLALLE
jgi:hypothetical protein